MLPEGMLQGALGVPVAVPAEGWPREMPLALPQSTDGLQEVVLIQVLLPAGQ